MEHNARSTEQENLCDMAGKENAYGSVTHRLIEKAMETPGALKNFRTR